MHSKRIQLTKDAVEDDSSKKKNRSKYTEEEDLKILEYIKNSPGSNLMSRKYWQIAVDRDNLLDKKRSVESLRERYRNHLIGILKYGADYQPPKSNKGENASNAYKYGPSISDSILGSKGKAKNQMTKIEKEFLGDDDENDQQTSKNMKSIRERKSLGYENVENGASLLRFMKKDKKLITVLDNTNANKRKEYEGMNQVNSVGLPSKKANLIEKIVKPQLLNQEEVRLLEDKRIWVKECARKHNLTPDQFLDLFFRCSMNYQILEKYLEGYTDLAWDEDEDTILRNPRSEAEKKMLVSYKGLLNVEQRENFFEKLRVLRPLFSNNS